jgi:hypothetical protein
METMYERRRQKPIPRRAFAWRFLAHLGAAAGLVGSSLLAGMAGFRSLEGMSWLEAFLNASMLLGGMGPIDIPRTSPGKLFAGFYALYAGLAFLIVAGVLFTPVFHRVLHRFHWEEDDDEAVATRSHLPRRR